MSPGYWLCMLPVTIAICAASIRVATPARAETATGQRIVVKKLPPSPCKGASDCRKAGGEQINVGTSSTTAGTITPRPKGETFMRANEPRTLPPSPVIQPIPAATRKP